MTTCPVGLPHVGAGLADGGPGGSVLPSLVSSSNNSAKTVSVKCDKFLILKGECWSHGLHRWRVVPCGRRECPFCGPVGRYRIAQRIAWGVNALWPAAWLVLTFASDEFEFGSAKKLAVRKMGAFIRKLRKAQGQKFPYACTYELTERGRLHINLVCGDWLFIPQVKLQSWWGSRLYVSRIRDSETLGIEVAKAGKNQFSAENLASYLSKLDQAVPREWGRRCSFSRSWPRLPKETIVRAGDVNFELATIEDRIEFYVADGEGDLWVSGRNEVGRKGEACECFDILNKST